MIQFNPQKTFLCCALLTGLLCTPARAEPAPPSTALQELAKKFVKKLDPFYANIKTPQKAKALSFIPDGSVLLLKPQVEKLLYDGDIYSVKKDNQIYLSLIDVIDTLGLAIEFDENTQTGNGWVLREDWNFEIDIANKTVSSQGKTYPILERDILIQEGITFLAGPSLERWLNFRFDYDLSQQYLIVQTPYPLPAIAKDQRNKRKIQSERRQNIAQLPRLKDNKKLLDIDAANITTGSRYTKSQGGKSRTRSFANVGVQGQLLKHDAYLFASRDTDEGLRSVTSRLSRRSENSDLLGPLNASLYEIGDINAINIPLTGSAQQSLGFRVENNPLINSDFNTTNIRGDGRPGWDVELFRNGVAINNLTIGDSGQYTFDEIPLFSGDNEFELFFYGPQGEIRTETLNVPITAALLKTQGDTYEASINLEERPTFAINQEADEDRGDPSIALKYNKYFGNSLGYLGLRNRPIEGDNKVFLSTGLTSVIGETILDTNAAIDDEANTALSIGARRKVKDWNIALSGQWNTDEYTTDEGTDPSIINLSARAQRPFTPIYGDQANLFANATYQETAGGTSRTATSLGISNQIKRLNISNTIAYEQFNGGTTPQEDRLDNNLAIRTNFGKTFLRAGIDYDILPDTKIDRYFSQINYRRTPKQSFDLRLDHDPDRDLSSGRLNMNYINDYFRSSPFIEVRSDDSVFGGLNLNFNLLDTPGETLPRVTSNQIIGRGIITSFVYHDKDGNYIFDGDDEPLPDVYVQSVNSKKRVQTDNKGYAVLDSIPVTRPTDVIIDQDTLPDTFMISGIEGLSVFPVAGETHHIDMPVHLAGEIDGTVYLQDEDGNKKPSPRKIIELISLDKPGAEPQIAETAFDGFYLFSKVPPGRYIMQVKQKKSKQKIGNAEPQFIDISYDGTTLYGQDITLFEGSEYVPYAVQQLSTQENTSPKPEQVLQVKVRGKTELSKLVTRLLMKKYADPLLSDLEKLSDIPSENHEFYTAKLSTLHNRCNSLKTFNISCKVIIYDTAALTK